MKPYLKLIGTPHFAQGEGDALCSLYSMSMFVAALFPSLRADVMDADGDIRDSPILKVLRKRRRDDFEVFFTRWFFEGLPFGPAPGTISAKLILEDIAQDELGARSKPYFEHVRFNGKRRYDNHVSFEEVAQKLERGLPGLMAGNGAGPIRQHAVVLVGYGADGAERNLIYLDPDRHGPSETQSVDELCRDTIDIIWPADGWPFPAPPMDRLEMDADDVLYVSRWSGQTGSQGEYVRWQRS